MLSFCIWERRKFPTSSHVSAPSFEVKCCIALLLLGLLFVHKDRMFYMCCDVSFVVGDVVIGWGEVECSVQEVLADGGVELFDVKANRTVVLFVFLMALNHSITDAVFFHWLNLDVLVILLLILSRIVLLILPISDLVGLIIGRSVC